MKTLCASTVLLGLANLCVAQELPTNQATIKARSTVVMVPAFVSSRDGQVIFGLQAKDFLLTDNGEPQQLKLEEDADSQPLALAVVVETGGLGTTHLEHYRELNAILDAFIGAVEHRVAVITFDATPHLTLDFTPNTDDASRILAGLSAGDHGAAILDAIRFAVSKLHEQPAPYRRAILLLSETVDQGSKTTLGEALRLVSDTNTAIYTFAFSSTRAAVSHEASKITSAEPGPAHGCFGREGADPEYQGHYSKQLLDCISQLAPPLRLATMSFLAARNGLRTNTAESLSQLTGGRFSHFHNANDLKAGLMALANDIPNYYVLSFTPSNPTPGLHALRLTVKDRPPAVAKSRREYWIDDSAPK